MSMFLPKDDGAALLRWAQADDADLRDLARLAPRLDGLFVLPCPTTPGAVVVGATFEGAGMRLSATGVGASRRAALAGCLGETAETLAQCAPPEVALRARLTDPACGLTDAERAPCAKRLDALGLDSASPLDWIVADVDGAECFVPAALVMRARPSGSARAAPALSVGCAAGATGADAARSAALELFERDALARSRTGPQAWRHAETSQAGAAALAGLGRLAGAPEVAFVRLDPPDGPLAVVGAFSELGFGSAAGETLAEAASAAARELAAAAAGALFAAARGAAPPRIERPALRCDGAARADASPGGYRLSLALTGLAHPVRRANLRAPMATVAVVKLICFALDFD